MNLRFEWINWINCVNTESTACNTGLFADSTRYKRSQSQIGFVNTGTGGCENRRPRGVGASVCANLARRARWHALCGLAGVRRRSGVAA